MGRSTCERVSDCKKSGKCRHAKPLNAITNDTGVILSHFLIIYISSRFLLCKSVYVHKSSFSFWCVLGVCIVRWRLSVYLHMFTMYGDYLNMWLLYNIKTMQIYKFAHNPVLLLFVHEPDQVSGRFIANRLVNVIIKIVLIMY